MEWRNAAKKIEKEQTQFDPNKQWTIETPVRAINERQQAKTKNQAMKDHLDTQVTHIVAVRQQSREADLDVGAELVRADLDQQVRDQQIQAYKRHEMAKSLREAWSKQQIYKNNQKQVESLFT